MPTLDHLVQDFLAQKTIAVVGVSDRRDTGCNTAYERFAENGYTVYPVNPRIPVFQGEVCYPDLRTLPEPPDAVFILARPEVTEQIVEEAVELGVGHVWMHCMMGVKPGLAKSMTSVSPKAVQMCLDNGIAVIPGTCPNQYLDVDGGHRFMNRFFGLLGFLKLPAQQVNR